MNRLFVLIPWLLMAGLAPAIAENQHGEIGEIVSADHRRVEADASLSAEIDRLRSDVRGPAWLTWTAPTVDGRHTMCCFQNGFGRDGSSASGRMCRLEGSNRNFGHSSDDGWQTTDTDLRVLLRIEDGRLDDLRAVTTDCSLDVGGLPFYTLDGVAPRQSVAFLESMVLDGVGGKTADKAIMAIALHGDVAADRSLETLTGRRAPADVREDAVFWLGAARGARGLERLEKLLESDPDGDVREKVVFAISISEADGAFDLLVAAARDHRSSGVREKALFWLGQQASERAVQTLKRAVDEDPNADVREQAVFAVSQLPRDEAVPLLIELARTNRHPEVRKSALFWLGQSGDSRALDLFEEILTD